MYMNLFADVEFIFEEIKVKNLHALSLLNLLMYL